MNFMDYIFSSFFAIFLNPAFYYKIFLTHIKIEIIQVLIFLPLTFTYF